MSRSADNFVREEDDQTKQLAQAILTTTPTSYYTTVIGKETIIAIGDMSIANVTNQDRWVSMWVDKNGSGVANAEIVCFEVPISKGDVWTNPFAIKLNESGGNISFEAQINAALTMTMNGIERPKS